MEVRLERGPENPATRKKKKKKKKKTRVVKKNQVIWVGTLAYALVIGSPSYEGFKKTKLAYSKVKIILKIKIENKRSPELGWFRGHDDYHVLNFAVYTPGFLPITHRPGTQAAGCVSCGQNIYFSLLRKMIRQK